MKIETGTVIEGKYRIVRAIGTGGMSVVFEAEAIRIHRRVALKVMTLSGPNLYALGVILYEALSGKLPFVAGTFMELAAKITREAPLPLHEHDPALDPEFCAIIAKAMARAPEARFSTARAFEEELAAWARIKRRDGPEPPAELSPKPPKAPWLVMATFAALALAASALVKSGGRGSSVTSTKSSESRSASSVSMPRLTEVPSSRPTSSSSIGPVVVPSTAVSARIRTVTEPTRKRRVNTTTVTKTRPAASAALKYTRSGRPIRSDL